jgi:hypothetical protein
MGDITITSEGLQNFGQGSALTAFEKGEIFIMSQFFRFHSKDRPIQSPLYDTQGDAKDLFSPDHHGFFMMMQ